MLLKLEHGAKMYGILKELKYLTHWTFCMVLVKQAKAIEKTAVFKIYIYDTICTTTVFPAVYLYIEVYILYVQNVFISIPSLPLLSATFLLQRFVHIIQWCVIQWSAPGQLSSAPM